MSERELFAQTASYAADFLETLDERPIAPGAGVTSYPGNYGAYLEKKLEAQEAELAVTE